jgi:hypothetical protein
MEATVWCFVTILALGSWPTQRLAKVQDKKETREAHLILPRVQESVREWTLTLPSDSHFGTWSSDELPNF